MPWYLRFYVYRKLTAVRSANCRQMPAVFQLQKSASSRPHIASYARLSRSMTAVAVWIPNGKNASSIIGDRYSVKAQIPSSGLLPGSMVSAAPHFLHRLGRPDVSALCIPPRMVDERRREEDISNRLPFTKKAVTWFEGVCDLLNGFGNDWIVLTESEYGWQDIMIAAEVLVNMPGLLRKGSAGFRHLLIKVPVE